MTNAVKTQIYWKVEITRRHGPTTEFVFLEEPNADACYAHYVATCDPECRVRKFRLATDDDQRFGKL